MRRLIPEHAAHVVVGYPPTYQSRVCYACERRRQIIGTVIISLIMGALAFTAGYCVTWAWHLAATEQGAVVSELPILPPFECEGCPPARANL